METIEAGDLVALMLPVSTLRGDTTLSAGTFLEVLGFRDHNRGVVELCADLALPGRGNPIAYVAPRFLRKVTR